MPEDPYLSPRSTVPQLRHSGGLIFYLARLAFVLINLWLAAGSLFTCVWVLGSTHYSWSLVSQILALAMGVAGILLAASSLLLGRARYSGHTLIASMLVITLLAWRESFLAFREFGQGLEFPVVLLTAWLAICMVYVRTRPNNSFKPKSLRGSA